MLFVEDETDIRNLTAQMLRDRRHRVIEARDAQSALAALRQWLTRGTGLEVSAGISLLRKPFSFESLAARIESLIADRS